jgi:hypothetical protein
MYRISQLCSNYKPKGIPSGIPKARSYERLIAAYFYKLNFDDNSL